MIFLAILMCVAMVSCQAPGPRLKTGCCTPPQWEGYQGGVGGFVSNGQPQSLTSIAKVAFDRAKLRQYAFTNTTTTSGFFSVKTIQDFKDGKQWTIDVLKNTCVKSDIATNFTAGCIPDGAREVGSFYVGSGSDRLLANSYFLRKGSLNITIAVTQSECVPISESISGSVSQVPMVVVIGFVDIIPKISDPSVFSPPAICKENGTFEIPPSHVDPKFHVLHV